MPGLTTPVTSQRKHVKRLLTGYDFEKFYILTFYSLVYIEIL